MLFWGGMVSNPFRESFSRAPGYRATDVTYLTLFQTPFGNHSRAHSHRHHRNRFPCPRFKPLSGIILARTRMVKGRVLVVGFVSNPFRESFSRALSTTPEPGYERVKVSNPFRESFSRAPYQSCLRCRSRFRFKPLSGIILARTDRLRV